MQLLTPRQQQELGRISTELRRPARSKIFDQEAVADSIFIVERGVVKSVRDLPSGKRRVMAFLFPGDVFGLAEGGHYVNSTQAVTDSSICRILREALVETLRRDRELEVQFLCKVTHELRELQRQQIVVTRRDAPGRIAMFLRMLDQQRRKDGNAIDIPMSRSDIAQYLSLSPEAVSRATASLEHDGIVSFPSLHTANVLNRARFERLAAAV